MSTTIPYELILVQTTTSGGVATLSYPVPPGQDLEIDEFVWQSTGAFSVTGIRNGGGQQFSNAASSNAIPSIMLNNTSNNFSLMRDFKPNLVIKGGDTLYIDVIDTSGAGNTIRFLGNCNKVLQ